MSRNGASEYGPRGTRSVKECPKERPEGAELFTAQNTGVPNVTLHSAPWVVAPQGDLGTLGLGKQLECAFCPCQHLYGTFSGVHSSLSEKKNKDFAGHLGDTPKVTLRKSYQAPADLRRFAFMCVFFCVFAAACFYCLFALFCFSASDCVSDNEIRARPCSNKGLNEFAP